MFSCHARWSFASVVTAALLVGCNSPPDIGLRLFGYVDTQGRIVIAPAFLDARPFHEGRAAVKGREGWGFIDARGRWVVPAQYAEAESFSDGRARVRNFEGAWGYVDWSGRRVIPPQFTCESPFFGGHAIVQPAKGPVQVIDAIGHTIRELAGVELSDCDLESEDPTQSEPFSAWTSIVAAFDEEKLEALQKERLYAARFVPEEARVVPQSSQSAPSHKNGNGLQEVVVSPTRIGYLGPAGNWAIAPVPMTEAGPFVDGLARVNVSGKVGFIDRSGRVVVPLQFDDALYRFSRDRTVALRDGHAWIIDREGRALSDLGAWPWQGLWEYERFNSVEYFVGLRDFFADGLIPWRRASGWDYVGIDGKWLTNSPRYSSAQPFHGGFANVQVGERWLLIDVKGDTVAETSDGWIGPRAGALARVGTSTRWGFGGKDGRLPKQMPFATAQVEFGSTSFIDTRPLQFSEGLAVVSEIARPVWRLFDEHGVVHASGRFEEPIAYLGRDRFAYLDDERWGLMDTHFRVLVPARFQVRLSRSELPSESESKSGRALISSDSTIYRHQYIFARSQGLGGCIDRLGRWAFPPQPLLNATCGRPVMAARAATGWGALGMDGRWRIPPKYESISVLSERPPIFVTVTKDQQTQLVRLTARGARYSAPGVEFPCSAPSLCMFKVNNRWRRLDPNSLQPTGPKFADVHSTGTIALSTGALRNIGEWVRYGGRWGYFDKSGRLVVPISYDQVDWQSEGERPAVVVRRGRNWGVVSLLSGRIVVPMRFDQLKVAGQGYYAMRVGTKWGVVRAGGRETVAPRYDDVIDAREGLMLVKHAGRDSLLTVTGKAVLDPPPEWMQRIERLWNHSEEAWSALTKDGHLYFIAKRSLAVHELHAPGGYAWGRDIVATGTPQIGDVKLANAPDGDSRAANRVVLIDGTGHLIVPEVFDSASWSASAKRFTVWRHGRCGVIDGRGHWVLPIRHDHCWDIGKPAWVIVGDD